MRKKERERDALFACQVFDECPYAVLATVNPDGSPYCIPVSAVRIENALYFHAALEGQKTENLRRFPEACLTAVSHAKLTPESLSVDYRSAVASGRAEEVLNPEEKMAALREITRRFAPSRLSQLEPILLKQLDQTAVWKIPIRTATGKCRETL